MVRRAALTADELMHAYVCIRKRHWPAAPCAMAHPLYGRLIRAYAWALRHRAAQHDPRRLAAGELQHSVTDPTTTP